MGNYFMQRDDSEEAIMKTNNNLAQLVSNDKTKTTKFDVFIQGKHRTFGQERVL